MNFINDYIHYKLWDENMYPNPHFNGCTIEIYDRISNLIPLFIWADGYLWCLT